MDTASRSSSSARFPFFGAGHASYYEWAEVLLCFSRAPTEAEQAQLLARVPAPLGASPLAGRMFSAGAGQFVNMSIEQAYDEGALPEDVIEDFGDEEMAQRFYVSAEAACAFEAAIEDWLIAADQIVPIAFAARAPDLEAGGTRLSAWHHESTAALPALLAQWTAEPRYQGATYDLEEAERRLFSHALRIALDFGELAIASLPDPFAKAIFPEAWIAAAWTDRFEEALAALHALLAARGFRHSVADLIVQGAEQAIERERWEHALRLLSLVLTQERPLQPAAKIARAFARSPALLEAPSAQAALVAALSGHARSSEDREDCDSILYLNEIAAVAFAITQEAQPGGARWERAIALYRLALQIEGAPAIARLEAFANALYALQEDNTGLPVDPARNAWFLARCLPYAEANPAIFENAMCLYAEMGEFEEAMKCARAAIARSYCQRERMRRDMAQLPMFATLRESPWYSDFDKE